MAKDTDLGGDPGLPAKLVQVPENGTDVVHGPIRGVHPDETVPHAHGQIRVNHHGDGVQVVLRVVGLKPVGEGFRKADKGSGPGGLEDFAGDEDQLMHVHEFGQGRYGHRSQRLADLHDPCPLTPEKFILEFPQGERGDPLKYLSINIVTCPHHRVHPAVIIGQGSIVEVLHGQRGENGTGGFSLHLVGGRKAAGSVSGFADVGGPQELLKTPE